MSTKLISLFAIALFLVSCEDSIDSKNKETYNYSFNQWKKLKKQNGNSYEYKTTFSSWVGYSTRTTVYIENDIVTSRECYVTYHNPETFNIDTLNYYIESEREIGVNEIGANPLTIDELYDSCAGEYLKVDSKKNTIYMETNKDGLLNLCGFVPDNCADDCYFGIKIDTIIWKNN